MKSKILLILISLGVYSQVCSQLPTLSFTAEINDAYVPLDSVLIQNLTQGGDTTLYSPDSVLVLDNIVTSIGEIASSSANGFTLSQNYPNPIQGTTDIDLNLSENQNVTISIGDLTGREIFRKQMELEPGNHIMTFTPGSQGVYLLTAITSQRSVTIKMINSGMTGFNESVYLEYKGKEKAGNRIRSGNQMKSIGYELGDQLSFTAFTEFGNMTLIDAPVVDQTYTFDFATAGIPCPDSPTVTDVQGNVYNTVLIGSDCWMKENLRTTQFNNEVLIPNYPDEEEWENLETPGYVWYDNDVNWAEEYGAMYNGYAFIDPDNVCPVGWHPSTQVEWEALFFLISGAEGPFQDPHGNQLKSCRQVDSPFGGECNTTEHPRWDQDPVDNGTDEYGFSALPGGRRVFGGLFEGPDFDGIGVVGYWWTDYETDDDLQTYYLHNQLGSVAGSLNAKNIGASIRCVKD